MQQEAPQEPSPRGAHLDGASTRVGDERHRPRQRQLLHQLRIDRSTASRDRGEGSGKTGYRWLAALVGLLLAGAVFLWWRGQPAPVLPDATEELEVRQPEPVQGLGPTAILDASGYVVARRKATVSSKVTGRVAEVLVEEGVTVEAGQLLARLESDLLTERLRLAEAQLAAARSTTREIEVRLEEAERDVRRLRDLSAAGISARAALDSGLSERDALAARLESARTEIEVASREVAVRRQELDDTFIRAPFRGVAISKDAQPGEIVSPTSGGGAFTRTGLCTLVDMESLEIEVDVNEAYIHRVRSGQPVTALLDAYPDWPIAATVITTVPAADRQKATVRVRIAFDEPGDPRLLPDMGVKVSFLEPVPRAH